MIRRAGKTMKHIELGVVVGRHKAKADAKLHSDAMRLGYTPDDVRRLKPTKRTDY